MAFRRQDQAGAWRSLTFRRGALRRQDAPRDLSPCCMAAFACAVALDRAEVSPVQFSARKWRKRYSGAAAYDKGKPQPAG